MKVELSIAVNLLTVLAAIRVAAFMESSQLSYDDYRGAPPQPVVVSSNNNNPPPTPDAIEPPTEKSPSADSRLQSPCAEPGLVVTEGAVIDQLFGPASNYSKLKRPVVDARETVVVQIGLRLLGIQDFVSDFIEF